MHALQGVTAASDANCAAMPSRRGATMTVLRKGDRAMLTGQSVTVLEGELVS
jgi:hypothetical protein